MGNLPQEINYGAYTLWAMGAAANQDNPGGQVLLALGVLAGVIKLTDFAMTFYKNHFKKK